MKIVHFLKVPKSGKRNSHEIPVVTPDFSVLHKEDSDGLTFEGFLLQADVPDSYEGKYEGHSFGILLEENDIAPFRRFLEACARVRKDVEKDTD